MEAAARDLEGFRGFKRLKAGKRQALNALTTEGYAGKCQAAMLEQQKLTARGFGGSCCEGFGGF